jgi:hypothetical protein
LKAIFIVSEEIMSQDSAAFWLRNLEIADNLFGPYMPKTVWCPIKNWEQITMMLEGYKEYNEYNRLYDSLKPAIEQIGLPAFIRTDFSSAKHGGPKAYLITDPEDYNRQLGETLEYTALKTMFSKNKPSAILVREFLKLEHKFTAFGGLPISNEWRYFSDGEKILCKHPYWPKEALESYAKDPEWQSKLDSYVGTDTMDNLIINAAKIQCENIWSVDIAKDENGKWWLTDMATAANSYHWPSCLNQF